MSATLPLYWNLSSPVDEERIIASVQLIDTLQKFQQSFVADRTEQSEATSTIESLDTLNAQDVAYALRRLVRGLASPRESSRLGFAVVLAELLHRIDTVSSAQMIDLVLSSSEVTGSMTGQEERDMMFSRLFGLTSIAQSGLILRETPPPHVSSPASTLQDYQRIITELVTLGDAKTWFRESCWWGILQIISIISTSSVSFKSEAMQWTLNELFIQNTAWSSEKIAMWLKYQYLWEGMSQAPLQPLFKGRHPLASSCLGHLSHILADITVEEEGTSHGSSGTWRPNAHFVWSIIFDIYFPIGPPDSSKEISSFQDFFRVVVDEQFFSPTASPERKYIGFQIVDSAVKRSPPTVIPQLFTKSFVRTWINQLAKRDRYLHKAALKLATTVQNSVQREPSTGFPLIAQLLGPNGSREFDRLSNTKVVETIPGHMKESQIAEYVEFLTLMFKDIPKDSNNSVIDSDQKWAIEQLSSLLRSALVPKSDSWVIAALEFYIRNGFFESSPEKKKVFTQLPESIRQICREKLHMSLADLSSQATSDHSDAKTAKFNGKSASGEYWVSIVVQTFRKLSKEKGLRALWDDGEEISSIRSRARSMIKSLSLIHDPKLEAAQGSILLIAALLLQTYDLREENSDTGSPLNDTLDNVSSLFNLPSKDKVGTEPATNGIASMEIDSSQERPFDLIVDDLIGHLEKPEPLMRSIAPQIFSTMCSEVREPTVELLLTQLQRRNVLSDEVSEREDEEENSTGDSEVQEAENDDTEHTTGSSTSESSEPSEDEPEIEGADPELRKKIAEALGEKGSGGSDTGSDSSSELFMDDDQMMELDGKLAEVFRSQSLSSKAKTITGLQREATHFKIRVLDLIEIFIRKQPNDVHLPLIILPLIRVVMDCSSDEQQLVDKINGIIRRRIGILHAPIGDVDLVRVSADLEEVHNIARKASHQQISPATLTFASTYMSKICIDRNRMDIPARIYKESLDDFMQRKGCKVYHTFFADSIKRVPSVAWAIREDLIRACASGNAVNTYRQMQAAYWVDAFLPLVPQMAGDDKGSISSTMKLVQDAVYHSLIEATTGRHPLSVAQAKTLAKMALQAMRITARIDGVDMTEVWQLQRFNHVLAEVSSCQKLRKGGGLMAIMHQMATRLGVAQQGDPKRKANKEKKRKAREEKQTEKPRKKLKKHQK